MVELHIKALNPSQGIVFVMIRDPYTATTEIHALGHCLLPNDWISNGNQSIFCSAS